MTNDDDGPDHATVTLRVDSDQRDRWHEYADESNEHPSLSQLIRASVEREIAGGGQGGGTSDELMEAVVDVADRTRRMDARLDNVTDELGSIRDSLQEPSEDLKTLMGDIFDVLPTEDQVNEPGVNIYGDEPDTPILEGDDGTRYVWSGKVSDIADHLDSKQYRVRQAIDQLQQDTSMVESVVIGGEERFIRGN